MIHILKIRIAAEQALMTGAVKAVCVFVIWSCLISSFVYATTYETQTHMTSQAIINSTWLEGWDKRLKLTIDRNDITSDLSNFPVLVHLGNTSGWKSDDVTFVFDELVGDANRKKIAVTTIDNNTQCYVEIEKWDSANEQAWLWVKVPSISTTEDTWLYLYYDKDNAENTEYVGDTGSTPAQNVWDSNYKGVWHLSEDPNGTAPQMKDSSSNNNHGTSGGSMTSNDQVAGQIDGNLDFDGTNDYINAGNSASLNFSNNFAIETWFSPTTAFNATADYLQGLLDKGGYRLFLDRSDGKLKAEVTNGSTTVSTSYNGAQEVIRSLAVYDGKLYAGQGDSSGDGNVLVFDGSTWSTSYNGAQERIESLAVYNGKLYAGQGYGFGDGDVLVFDGSTWSTSYNGAQEVIRSLAVYNGKLYAGQGDSTGDGDVLVFDGSTWSTSYDGAQERMDSLTVYNGALYAGQGSGAGDGDVFVFDGSTWSISSNGTQEVIYSLAVYNGKLYAGQGESTGDGDVLVFDGSTWSTSFDGAQEVIFSLAVYNGKLYAAQGNGFGDGDVLVFDGSTWSTSYNGAQEIIRSLAIYDGKLYAGQGSGFGDGDVLVLNAGSDIESTTTSWSASYHHAMVTKNSTTLTLYIDGSQQASVTVSATIETNALDLLIGKAYGTRGTGVGEGLYSGRIDEVRISNDARNAAWTKASYESGRDNLIDFGPEDMQNRYSIDASGGYMIVGSGTPNWGSVSGTISFWIKWDVVGNRPWGQHGNMEIRFSGTNLLLDWGGDASLTSNTSFIPDKWYFIAIVWNEGTDQLYLYVGDQNNVPVLDATNNTWTSAVSIVGVTQNNFLASRGGMNPTDGHGDELRYWNIDRSLTNIQSDYNLELTGLEPSLQSYYRLNNNLDDSGINNNEGTGSGSYSFSLDVPFS